MTFQISSVKSCVLDTQSLSCVSKLIKTAAIGLCFFPGNARSNEEGNPVDGLEVDMLTAESGSHGSRRNPRGGKSFGFKDARKIICGPPIEDPVLRESQLNKVTRFIEERLADCKRHPSYSGATRQALHDFLYESITRKRFLEAVAIAVPFRGEYSLSLLDFQSFDSQLDCMLDNTCKNTSKISLNLMAMTQILKYAKRVEADVDSQFVSCFLEKIELVDKQYPGQSSLDVFKNQIKASLQSQIAAIDVSLENPWMKQIVRARPKSKHVM